MQRREFHGNAGAIRQSHIARTLANRMNGAGIRVIITRGVGRRARTLTQHIERIAIELALFGGRALQGLANVLAEHKM